MANIPDVPNPVWAAVPLLDNDTLVLGGLDGPSNYQGKALAERTQFLKERNDKTQFRTRQDFITAVASGSLNSLVSGITATAAGLNYVRAPGSTEIPDLPGWKPPQGAETFAHYGGPQSDNATPRASIRHMRDRSFLYEVTTISNHRPGTLRKIYAGNPSAGQTTKIKIQQFAKNTNNRYPAIFNADGWRGIGTGDPVIDAIAVPIGLQIADGVVYQDWLPTETRKRGIAMTKAGLLIETSRDDGLTGQQWVSERGVLWTVGWGDICVRNGSAVNMTGSYTGTAVSARTVLGQKPNGDILIFTIEGLTSEYGASPQQCADLAASYGCRIAYICDGGGSAQAWWGGAYAMHSSDAYSGDPVRVGERAIPSMLVVDVPSVEDYDTGWIKATEADGIVAKVADFPAVSFRQLRDEVTFQVNIQGAFMKGEVSLIAKNTFPDRFRPSDVALAKGVVLGDSGFLVSVFMGGGLSLNPQVSNVLYAVGQIRWPTRFANLPVRN